MWPLKSLSFFSYTKAPNKICLPCTPKKAPLTLSRAVRPPTAAGWRAAFHLEGVSATLTADSSNRSGHRGNTRPLSAWLEPPGESAHASVHITTGCRHGRHNHTGLKEARTHAHTYAHMFACMCWVPEQAPPPDISSPSGSATACKVFFRLASFADARYRELVAQRSTPEYKTYGRIIEVSTRPKAGSSR